MGDITHRQLWSRRDFLRRSAVMGAGLGLGPAAAAWGADAPAIRRRVTLGRTGIEVPDIGFGSFALAGDVRLVHHALDRGITHFDTAESYTDGQAERTLGAALHDRRDRVTITTKVKAEPADSAERLMRRLEASLRRLRTDHVDVYLNHAVNDLARLTNPAWPEFVARAKAQGKIRAAGMSGHGSILATCLDTALEQDLVDVVLVAYNFSQDPGFLERAKQRAWDFVAGFDLVAPQQRLPDLLVRAHEKGVGVMTMKTLKGARKNDMRPYEGGGATFAQAAFRWVLSNDAVDALVVTMKDPAAVDEYVAASGGGRPGASDLALLGRYESLHAGTQCQPGCSGCTGACPAGVDPAEVLRTRMYAVDYELPEIAAREYASLERDASPCLSCLAPACERACPSGLPIAALSRDMHAVQQRTHGVSTPRGKSARA